MARPRKLDSGRWRIEFMCGGIRHSRTFDRRKDCIEYERQARTDHARGVFIPPDRQREKVADRLDLWLDTKSQEPGFAENSLTLYKLMVRLHITPHLGNLTLEHITVETVERWRNLLTETTTPANAHKAFQVLSSFLTDQERYGYVPRNVARLVKAPEYKSRDMTVLEPWELAALVDALKGKPCSWTDEVGPHAMPTDHPDWLLRSGWAADVVLGLALIGCRFGDLAALTPEHWDRINGKLTINDRKSGRTRVLPVFPAVREVLDRCVARGGDRLFMSDGRKGQARLYPAFNGDHFKPALVEAGIDRKFVPHELRHTAASILISKGFGPAHVAAYLGHASPTITLKTYAHLFADDMASMGDALDDMWQVAQEGPGENVTPIRPASNE